MVVSTLKIVPPPSRHREVLELLQSIKGPTQAHSDCISCRVYEEDDSERGILLFEEWISEAAFFEQIRSDLFRRVLAAIELSSRAPDVAIHHVSSTDGFELIQRLRGAEQSNSTML